MLLCPASRFVYVKKIAIAGASQSGASSWCVRGVRCDNIISSCPLTMSMSEGLIDDDDTWEDFWGKFIVYPRIFEAAALGRFSKVVGEVGLCRGD